MNIHKRTELTPLQREKIYLKHHREHVQVVLSAQEYHVSRPTIYKILAQGSKHDFSVYNSGNTRFRCLQWGVKRPAKIEKKIEDKLKKEAKRCNKKYPGEMVHMDCKRLPVLEGQSKTELRESMFVAIDDFSRERYVAVMPDKTAVFIDDMSLKPRALDEYPLIRDIFKTPDNPVFKMFYIEVQEARTFSFAEGTQSQNP